MNTITLTHADGRHAFYKLSIEPEGNGFAVFADYGKIGVYTRCSKFSHSTTRTYAKNLFDKKILEKKRGGYNVLQQNP